MTTRHGELGVGRRSVRLDQLSDRDALQLVADWVETSVEELPPEAHEAVRQCGNHPFAISLNAAAASQGLPWSMIAKALANRELDFAEHRFDEYVYETVEQSLQVSVAALSEDDRARYRELAAFFWESGVRAAAIARFWEKRSGLRPHQAVKLLVFLRQRSLLELHGDPAKYEVRLHDLHHAFIGKDARTVDGFAEALLESYQPSVRGAWWSVTDDGYFQDHVVRHLARSRTETELLSLFSAEDEKHRSRWYRSRQFHGYADDVQIASEHTENSLLLLITVSLRSLAKSVPAELLGVAVGAGWSLNQAMSQARLISDPSKRAAAMIALLPSVEDRAPWLGDALSAMEEADVRDRSDLIQSLAAIARETELISILRRIVSWVRNAGSRYEEANLLPIAEHVLRRVDGTMAAEAIEIAAEIGIRPLHLYPLLPKPRCSELIHRELAQARLPKDGVGVAHRAFVVARLADHLDYERRAREVAEALHGARALDPGIMRQVALRNLLPLLSADDQQPILYELIAAAIENPHDFVQLAKHVPEVWHGEICKALEGQDTWCIVATAPELAVEPRAPLVERALSEIEERTNATSLLHDLIPLLDAEQLERALRIIRRRLDEWQKAEALIKVARVRPANQREEALREALEAIDHLLEADDRERAYQKIAPLLIPRDLNTVLSAAQCIGEPSGTAHVARMLPHLSSDIRQNAAELFVRHARENPIVSWLCALKSIPPALEIVALDQLLDVARGRTIEQGRAHCLASLVSRVTSIQSVQTKVEAIAASRAYEQDEGILLRHRVALWLELGCVDEALSLVERVHIYDADELAEVTVMLAPHLDPVTCEHWVQRALYQASRSHRGLLDKLAPCLPLGQARSALASKIVPYEYVAKAPLVLTENDSRAAGKLALRMASLGDTLGAFNLVSVGRDDGVTAAALVELAPSLSAEQVRMIESRVLTASIESIAVDAGIGSSLYSREVARSYLAARLAPSLARVGEVARSLTYAHSAPEEHRVAAFLGIAEATTSDTRTQALLDALRAALDLREVHRRDQLDRVATALAGDPPAAEAGWRLATDWAREHPRHEAIEVLATLSQIAAAIGGTALVDEFYNSIERVLRWWP